MPKEKAPIRVIFIDAQKQEITEIEVVPTLPNYYKLIDCTRIEAVYPFRPDAMYIDEEGTFRETKFGIEISGYGVLIGNAVIVGTTRAGNASSAKTKLEDVKSRVKFLGEIEVDF